MPSTGSTRRRSASCRSRPRSTCCRPRAPATASPSWRLCDTDPFKSNDARMALKYGIDRQKIVDTVYKGYASIGNDTTIGPANKYFAQNNPPHAYDPDKAASLWKKAGSPAIELQVSEGAFSGATDAGVLYQEAMKKAGIDLERQARLGRRLLGQRLAQGAVLRRLLGRPSDGRPAAVADLLLDRQLERHALARPGLRQDRHRRRASNSTRPSASRCMPRPST